LSLRFKTRDHFFGIHAGFDNLQRDLAPHRRGLFCHVDDAESTFSNLLEQPIGTNTVPRPFRNGREDAGGVRRRNSTEKISGLLMGTQKSLNLKPQFRILSTSDVNALVHCFGALFFDYSEENFSGFDGNRHRQVS
jgi:hypothetical protein